MLLSARYRIAFNRAPLTDDERGAPSDTLNTKIQEHHSPNHLTLSKGLPLLTDNLPLTIL